MKIKAIALATVVAMPCAANAGTWFQYEAEIGFNHYNVENGRWFQSGMPGNRVESNAPTFGAGFHGDLWTRESWGVSWHADYEYLGRAAAACLCTTDQNYDSNHRKAIEPDDNLTGFTGSGNTHGVALTLEPFYIYRGVRFGVEAGAFIHHTSWEEYITPGPRDGDRTLQYVSGHAWSVSPVAGLSVSKGPWTVSYRHYFLRRAVQVPPVWNDADVLSIKYSF